MHVWESLSHVRWECKYHRCDHTEVSEEGVVWKPAPNTVGANPSRVEPFEGSAHAGPMHILSIIQCSSHERIPEGEACATLRRE